MPRSNNNLLEATRSKLIQVKVGLLSKDELCSWVDDQIRALPETPYFLIAVSMDDETELRGIDRLDLVLQQPDDSDGADLAAQILDRLESGLIEIDDVEGVAIRCGEALDKASDCWQSFDWIADELYLAREGVKDQTQSHIDVLDALRNMTK